VSIKQLLPQPTENEESDWLPFGDRSVRRVCRQFPDIGVESDDHHFIWGVNGPELCCEVYIPGPCRTEMLRQHHLAVGRYFAVQPPASTEELHPVSLPRWDESDFISFETEVSTELDRVISSIQPLNPPPVFRRQVTVACPVEPVSADLPVDNSCTSSIPTAENEVCTDNFIHPVMHATSESTVLPQFQRTLLTPQEVINHAIAAGYMIPIPDLVKRLFRIIQSEPNLSPEVLADVIARWVPREAEFTAWVIGMTFATTVSNFVCRPTDEVQSSELSESVNYIDTSDQPAFDIDSTQNIPVVTPEVLVSGSVHQPVIVNEDIVEPKTPSPFSLQISPSELSINIDDIVSEVIVSSADDNLQLLMQTAAALQYQPSVSVSDLNNNSTTVQPKHKRTKSEGASSRHAIRYEINEEGPLSKKEARILKERNRKKKSRQEKKTANTEINQTDIADTANVANSDRNCADSFFANSDENCADSFLTLDLQWSPLNRRL
jgi:hypothetical protein